MINRYFYQSDIASFLAEDTDTIFGKIARSDEMTTMDTQKFAWLEEIAIMKEVLAPYANEQAYIIFEFTIPRFGKRIDVVLLLRERVFVIEFKAGEDDYYSVDVDQVRGYALDLKNYHQGSADRMIVPVLVATESSEYSRECPLSYYSDEVYEPLKTNRSQLGDIIRLVLSDTIPEQDYAISMADWSRSRYAPTPTIIDAARTLYANHKVVDIEKREADNAQLETTTNYIQDVIVKTKARGGKSICFVTGVPGAGKTLVGLNVAVKQEDKELAVYLSGNGPLVQVLTEALTRDKQAQEKANGNPITKKTAESEVKRFIQIIHRYRDNMLNKVKLVNGALEIEPTKELRDDTAGYGEVENIAIFDEAQRSWDKEHIAAWLKRKKGFENFPMSEGEFLIWSLDQREDWAVIVCLVGGGQEINTGEAGIGEWIRALNETFPHWQIHISEELTAKEYAEGQVRELLANNPNVVYSNDLHLAVAQRCFRAKGLSDWVHALLNAEKEKALQIIEEMGGDYPLYLTRNLDKAKEWLRSKGTEDSRYGLLVSSKAYRLKPLAIDVRCKPDTVHWFLDDINDVRSSLFLEDVATEFDVQGLELDWTCVVWDGDLRYTNAGWNFFEFNGGNKWNKIQKEERRAYLINAYRVLLTRARQGMILCVPEGNPEDPTRLPEFYDSTYQYLKSLGIEEI